VGEGSKEGSDSAKSEIMTPDWVVRRVKFFVMSWDCLVRYLRSSCWCCLQLLKQAETRIIWLTILLFSLANINNRGKRELKEVGLLNKL
jgi:hypothetical protein